jgi:hypothetical protein
MVYAGTPKLKETVISSTGTTTSSPAQATRTRDRNRNQPNNYNV